VPNRFINRLREIAIPESHPMKWRWAMEAN
jgi:hypothetical protein